MTRFNFIMPRYCGYDLDVPRYRGPDFDMPRYHGPNLFVPRYCSGLGAPRYVLWLVLSDG